MSNEKQIVKSILLRDVPSDVLQIISRYKGELGAKRKCTFVSNSDAVFSLIRKWNENQTEK